MEKSQIIAGIFFIPLLICLVYIMIKLPKNKGKKYFNDITLPEVIYNALFGGIVVLEVSFIQGFINDIVENDFLSWLIAFLIMTCLILLIKNYFLRKSVN